MRELCKLYKKFEKLRQKIGQLAGLVQHIHK